VIFDCSPQSPDVVAKFGCRNINTHKSPDSQKQIRGGDIRGSVLSKRQRAQTTAESKIQREKSR
jgi:hypothetical protein